MTTFAATVFY